MRAALALALVSLTGAWAAGARADAIRPAPTDCPTGTLPRSSHAGPHCELAPPCAEGECGDDMACIEVGVCIREVECGGLRPPSAPPCSERHTAGQCDATGACPDGATCVRHPMCRPRVLATTPHIAPPALVPSTPPPEPTPAPAAPAPAPEPAGGCSVSSGASVSPMILAAALALFLRRARR
jgi:hypothetical protein